MLTSPEASSGHPLPPSTTQIFQLRYGSGSPSALKAALTELCASVEAAVRTGVECVILSDRPDADGMRANRPPVPALLAVGAVHHHLIRAGLRTETSIVADTAQCFTTHHLAMLVGYGAHAVCPYLGFESCRQWRASPRTEALIKTGKVGHSAARLLEHCALVCKAAKICSGFQQHVSLEGPARVNRCPT